MASTAKAAAAGAQYQHSNSTCAIDLTVVVVATAQWSSNFGLIPIMIAGLVNFLNHTVARSSEPTSQKLLAAWAHSHSK
jgi:hypothetical protein